MGTGDHVRIRRHTSKPVDAGQVQVEDHDVGRRALGERERLFAVDGDVDLVATRGERAQERPADLRFVVDDEDPFLPQEPALPFAAGTVKENVAPPPGVSSTQMSPSSRFTKPLQIARPSPGPSRGLRSSMR